MNLPKEPGRYRLTMALRNARGRPISPKNVPAFKPIIVSIAGPYRVGFDAPEAPGTGRSSGHVRRDEHRTSGVDRHDRSGRRRRWQRARISWPTGCSPIEAARRRVRSTSQLRPGASASVALPLTAMPTGATGLRLDLVGPDGRPISERGGRPTVVPILTTAAIQKPI